MDLQKRVKWLPALSMMMNLCLESPTCNLVSYPELIFVKNITNNIRGSKFVWRKICVEKKWQLWGLILPLSNCYPISVKVIRPILHILSPGSLQCYPPLSGWSGRWSQEPCNSLLITTITIIISTDHHYYYQWSTSSSSLLLCWQPCHSSNSKAVCPDTVVQASLRTNT